MACNRNGQPDINLLAVHQIATGLKTSRGTLDARIDSLVDLYAELDHTICMIASNRSNYLEALSSRAMRLIEAAREDELSFSRLLNLLEDQGLPNKATKSLTDINTSAIRTIEELESLRRISSANESQVLDRVCKRSMKDYLSKFESILLRDDADEIVSGLVEAYTEIQQALANDSTVHRVYERRRDLLRIESYLRRDDRLKELVEQLAATPGFDMGERLHLLGSLELLEFKHPRLSEVKEMVPEYTQSLEAMLAGAAEVEDAAGVSELINHAARNFIGNDEHGKTVPFVMGALNEIVANLRLKNAGFRIKKLGCRFVESKPFILDASGNDLLRGIDFHDPELALEELLRRELVVPSGRDQKQVYRFKACTISHLHYFDSVSGLIYAHKNNKKTADLRILVLDVDGEYTKMEIDCVAERDGKTYYIEHKFNVSCLIKKEQEGNGKTLSQIEKLVIVSRSHNCTPCIMLDIEELCSAGQKIEPSLPLYQEFRAMVKAIEGRYHAEVLILDSEANEVRLW